MRKAAPTHAPAHTNCLERIGARRTLRLCDVKTHRPGTVGPGRQRYPAFHVKVESLASRTTLLRPSPTLAITAKAKQLKAEGQDVVSFGAGEPDFNTPDSIIDAAQTALRGGQTKYTPTPGLPQLRQAIAEKLVQENNLKVTPDNIIVSCGAKHSLFNTMMTLVDPGDEVAVIAPYWMTYADQATLAGGNVVVANASAENGFVPTSEDIAQALSPRTKLLVINSPCNPSGAMISEETLRWIANEAEKRGFWVVSDEIYEKLVYGAQHKSIASFGESIAERTVTINGCSKSFAMTGWRIGYAAAPLPVAKAMSNLQDSVTSNATSFAQMGALEALKMSSEQIEPMRAEFEARRDLIVGLLAKIRGVKVSSPQGAFYVLPDVSAFLGGRIKDDSELASFLLEDALVATVPGSVFGAPGHLRLSYATSRKDIETGIARIGQSLGKLRE